jgi:hypothetical protein
MESVLTENIVLDLLLLGADLLRIASILQFLR